MDKVFPLKIMCEKYLESDLYVTSVDLEKKYNRIVRDALWKMLRI